MNAKRNAIAMIAAAAVAGSCSDSPAPPFVVKGTGSIAGIMFFDRDQNGLFDPSAGDTTLRNVHVYAAVRGTTQEITGGSTRTDANGRFEVDSLPPGTLSLQIDTVGVGAGVAFCTNPLPVSVYPGETRFVTVNARGGCVISIADAEAKSQGTRVTVSGTVTSSLAQISTGQAYLEDGTGGVQVFSPTGPTFKIGDVVEVAGTLSTFSNELELSPSTINSVKSGTPLTAADVTALDASNAGGSATANLQGRLLRIRAGKLLDAFTTGGGRNAQIRDASGTVTVRFDSHVVSDTTVLKTTFTVGKCYDWTGILKAFTSPPIEHFPRTLSDVVEVVCPQ